MNEKDLEKAYQIERNYLLRNSNIPQARWEPAALVPQQEDLEAFVRLKNIEENIKTFVSEGNNLYLFSEKYGNGKTTWSIKFLLSYINEVALGNRFRIRVLFIPVGHFLQKSKSVISMPDDEFDKLTARIETADLVVWDDIGTNTLTEYEHAKLYNHIGTRILNQKANIFTGNLKGEELSRAIGNRLASRVWNGSIRIELLGDDRRTSF